MLQISQTSTGSCNTNFEYINTNFEELDKTVSPRMRSGTCPPALLRLVRGVGASVGASVGESVGVAVGEAVGEAVGTGVL